MSYILNRTDGTILTELVDGILDTDTTDISLVGKNFTGYGEFINENFVKILENFANSTVPLSPMKGQLWYDTGVDKLKVYDGNEFTPASGSFVSPVPPRQPIAGDTWFNSGVNQLFLYDGEEFKLVGPQYTLQQGESGVFVRTVQDTNLNSRPVLEVRIGNMLQAVASQIEFVPDPSPGNPISELVTAENPTGRIYAGVNTVRPYAFVYRGTSSRAQNLITGEDPDTEFPTSSVLRNDQDGIIIGNLTLRGNVDSGSFPEIYLGNQETNIALKNSELVIENAILENDIRFIVAREEAGSNIPTDAVTIRAKDRRVGIFNSAPEHTIDIDGDARISGNLTVGGTATTVNSVDLIVADKNIVLGATDVPSDATANSGGITLKGATDKTLTWEDSTNSWTSSEHVDLASGKEFKINGQMVLSETTLGPGVLHAPSVEHVGVLNYVDINSIRIGALATEPDPMNNPSPVITRTGGATGITLDVAQGDIVVNNSKITMLEGPDGDSDATNKFYVDLEINKALLVFSMDITGWAPQNVNGNLIAYLEQVFPAAMIYNDKEAKIITTRITSETIEGINVMSNSNITYASVLVGPPGAAVVTDVGEITTREIVEDIVLPTNLSVPYEPTLVRETLHFVIRNGAWAANNIHSGTNVLPAPVGLQ